ncbi:right-handed parallel beta-helix repeat-containing protein [Flammeovirga sp. SubArs3]|uniref:alpha-1,3-galactosidase-related protein n=1 Tax=Flammeovirga sp. SubArs3 TaxID=2995316 RepID=UPI00248BD2A0|nr:right-handed parallel beta-helix repeat-containing protein [Flammeovirga sp. SubArs3]
MKRILVLFILIFTVIITSKGEEVIKIQPDGTNDMTRAVKQAIASAKSKEIKLIFEQADYYFKPDFATEKYCSVTNHKNGSKRIAFAFDGFNKVSIEGNGANLIFHGKMMPFQFESCENVTVNHLSIDWDTPFTIQGTVLKVNEKEHWMDIKMDTDGFSFSVNKGVIKFPNIHHQEYSSLGNTLTFDSLTKAVSHGAWDANFRAEKVQRLKGNTYRFYGRMKHYPKVGNKINFKGPHGDNRYAPAFHMIRSKNLKYDQVVVHHALGMGFLAERSENVSISNGGVYVRKGSNRLISSTADATHFCNVKGKVIVENCRFENMLDDGTNVHGTYVEISEILDPKTVIVQLKHFQQLGFDFAQKGDELWWVHQPSPDRRVETVFVTGSEVINEEYIQLSFAKELPKDLSVGDLFENKTWNPEFVMRGCTLQNHRARNIVLKSPKKTVIENNFFSSSMSAIFFRGESYFWYESGQVEDVLIQNNTFYNCASSGNEHAVLYITPRLGKSYDKSATYDKNIRFINNKINTFDDRIVWAYNVDGLEIEGNEITKNDLLAPVHPDRPIFDFNYCKNIVVKNNNYHGPKDQNIKTDKASSKEISIKKNKNIHLGKLDVVE